MFDSRLLLLATLLPVCYGAVSFTSPAGGTGSITVTENTEPTSIFMFTATTNGTNNGTAAMITYTVVSDPAGYFDISQNGGELRLKAGKKFDFETDKSINVNVTAKDNADPTATAMAMLTITVNDTDDVPMFGNLLPSCVVVAEDSTEGTLIGVYTAKDPDTQSAVKYSYDGDDDPAKFQYDATTGNLTRTSVPLKATTKALYKLTLNATDDDGNTETGILTAMIGGTCPTAGTSKTGGQAIGVILLVSLIQLISYCI